MDIDFRGRVGILSDLQPGTFFLTRDGQVSIFGISAVYGGGPTAILFNLAVRPDEPFPSMVMADFLGGKSLIGMTEAYFVPSLSRSALEFRSAQKDGPGSLILTRDKMFMRVSRRNEGFFYFDVSTGLIESNRPPGIEIPRWSVRIPEKAGSALTIFEFDGPKPVS
jgi:hypothetical protein